MMTLNDMLARAAADFPDKAAVVSRGETILYRELQSMVNRLARNLTDLGLRPGDRVGIMLPKIPELVVAYLGLGRSGAAGFPLTWALAKPDLEELFATLEPATIIGMYPFQTMIDRMKWEFRLPPIIVGKSPGRRQLGFAELVNQGASAEPAVEIRPDRTFYFNCTSGSSGRPKAAIATHENIYWNTRAAVEVFGMTEADVHLCCFAAFSHPHEIFSRPLFLGGTMVLQEGTNPRALSAAIRRHGVTCVMGLAHCYELMLNRGSSRADLSSLRIAESGGMRTPAELAGNFSRRFRIPILPVWGSTETSGIAIAASPRDPLKEGSLGKACPYYRVKLVDEHGAEVKTGEAGELAFQGGAIVKGYYRNSSDHETIKGGWYHSGDLARQDPEGYFYFLSRKSGVLKVAGWKVFPQEIETVLSSHPGIQEVAVTGVEDRLRELVPQAYVVLKNGWRLSKRDLTEFCNLRLARYKRPRLIEFLPSLPRLASGKVDFKALSSRRRPTGSPEFRPREVKKDRARRQRRDPASPPAKRSAKAARGHR